MIISEPKIRKQILQSLNPKNHSSDNDKKSKKSAPERKECARI